MYVSRPLASRDTATSRGSLAAIAGAFPTARIHDALALYRTNEEWLQRYRREIAASAAFIFLPHRSTIGYGVYCELCAAEDRGIPTLLYARGKFWNTWTLSILSHRYDWKRFARITPRGHPVDPAAIDLSKRSRLLPPGPLGRVIENRMVEYLLVLSEGRLVVYRPEADFEGTDLHVTLRHKAPVLKIQVKGVTFRNKGTYLRVQVRADAMPEGDPKHLLFVDYNLKAAEPRRFVWLVPVDDYRAKANRIGDYYKATMAASPTGADKWVDYRYNTRDIAWVVEELLKRA